MSPHSSSAHLEVLTGPLQGRLLSLSPPETLVGREVSPGISLSLYNQVSRNHARFYLYNDVWCVEDIGSTNGTFVNGTRATPSFSLTDGSVVQLGDFQARLRVSAPNAGVPLPGATQYAPPITPPYPLPVAPMPVMPVQVVPVSPYPVVYPVAPPKNTGLALLFSFLLIGGGQFYNGETEKGVGMLVGSIACGFFGLFTCGLTALACPVLWIWSMIDAYQSADRINRAAMNQPPY